MADSKIEWTDRSDWNPVRGCTRVSPGCGGPGPHGGCYAEAIAARFSAPGQPFHGFAEHTKSGPRWTGKVEVQWDRLDLPLRWRRPAKIFANSTSDWFHESLPVDEIANLYAVAVAAVHLRQHTIQILTKRAGRARAILNSEEFWEQVNVEAGAHVMEHTDPLNRRSDDARATCRDDYGPGNPPPGIWVGASVEDQPRADERIPDLLATPAAVRFLSCEPSLGLVDLRRWIAIDWQCSYCREFFTGTHKSHCPACGKEGGWTGSHAYNGRHYPRGPISPSQRGAGLDWVIVGGESGPDARPMPRAWARSLRDQCQAAGVPFFFKQHGEWIDADEWYAMHRAGPSRITLSLSGQEWQPAVPLNYTDAATIAELSGNRPFEHQSDGSTLVRVGKKAAGRLLDGRTWDEFPA